MKDEKYYFNEFIKSNFRAENHVIESIFGTSFVFEDFVKEENPDEIDMNIQNDFLDNGELYMPTRHVRREEGCNSSVEMRYFLSPSGIIRGKISPDGIRKTLVNWADGTQTIVTRKESDHEDAYNAFCAALTKKILGTTNMRQRLYVKYYDKK